jgi:hypothetical protein
MTGSNRRARTRHQYLSWSLLSFLAAYLLSLCTQCPLVYAGFFHQQVAQAHSSSAGHCTSSAAMPEAAGPVTADHERTTGPVCCDLMRAYRAITASPIQVDPSPVLLTLLPLDSDTPAWGVQSLYLVRVIHSSHPPPLYLLYTVLLI